MLVRTPEPPPTTIEELVGADLLASLDRLDVLSRKLFAGKLPGERRSKRRGQSVEFDDFRNYVPGDDLRHIDWNVYARLERLFIKLFREDEDLTVNVLVDNSLSMDAGDPSKALTAHRLAMTLAYIGLVNQNRVSLGVFGTPSAPGLLRLAPIRGRRSVRRAGEFLLASIARSEELERLARSRSRPTDADPFTDAMRSAAMTSSGSGVMIVLSDFFASPDPARGLDMIARRGGFDTTCIQLVAPGEIDPASEAPRGLVGDLRLVDAETGRNAEVTLSASSIKRYRERFESYVEQLESACTARSMLHLLVRSDADVGDLLLRVLRRRGVLG